LGKQMCYSVVIGGSCFWCGGQSLPYAPTRSPQNGVHATDLRSSCYMAFWKTVMCLSM